MPVCHCKRELTRWGSNVKRERKRERETGRASSDFPVSIPFSKITLSHSLIFHLLSQPSSSSSRGFSIEVIQSHRPCSNLYGVFLRPKCIAGLVCMMGHCSQCTDICHGRGKHQNWSARSFAVHSSARLLHAHMTISCLPSLPHHLDPFSAFLYIKQNSVVRYLQRAWEFASQPSLNKCAVVVVVWLYTHTSSVYFYHYLIECLWAGNGWWFITHPNQLASQIAFKGRKNLHKKWKFIPD